MEFFETILVAVAVVATVVRVAMIRPDSRVATSKK
jgi:hypothetical protein